MDISSDIPTEIKQRIEQSIADAKVQVITGGDRHYALVVSSKAFVGLTMVKQHQMVYSAIKDLMAGDQAPVHAIDRLEIGLE